MKNNIVKIVSLFTLVALLLISSSSVFALEPIEFSVVDPNAEFYGTFQSHNQKVVSNAYGIFVSSLHSRKVVFGNNTWWLSRSTDGGKTFSIVYQGANTLHTPPIETDPNGNIYAINTNTEGGNATLLRFEQKTDFSNPTVLATIPAGSAQKNAMILDWPRQQIYYAANHDYNTFASHDFRFYIIGLDGQIKKNIILTRAGTSAYAHYPHLYMDESNTLYLAWTTTNLTATLYWDIHFMLSKDGGQSWQKPDGTKLSIPVIADETGPTDDIVPNNEHSVNTWLWSMTVKNGKIHLPYTAQRTTWVQHYVRYDLKTAKIDINVTPKWQGEKVYFNNTDGFCATKKDIPDYPIYCVSRNGDWRFGVLVSYDNGTTWHDYAQSDFNDQNIYAIGGSREITSDGYLIGTYTDQTSDHHIVRFFRVKVENTAKSNSASASYWPMDETSGTIVNDREGSHNGKTTASIVDGKFGKARNFVSKVWNTNTKIWFPSFSANFDTGTGFTVEAWIKKDSSTAGYEHRVIGNRYSWSDPNGWNLTFNTNEKIDFSVQSASAPSINLRSTYALLTGTWYHIVGVYDNGTLKLYINGELNNTISGAGYTPSNRELTISGQPDGKNYGFDGLIDEVRIYSSALSAETIQQHFLGLNRADLNHDGKVNLLDYFYFVLAFYHGSVPQFINPDVNGDGLVNLEDRTIIVNALKGN